MKGPARMKNKEMMRAQNPKETIKRLFKLLKPFKWQIALVCLCILFSSLITISLTIFIRIAIDTYIIPLSKQASPELLPFIRALILMGCVSFLGVMSTYTYNRILINVTGTTMQKVRDDLFDHLQRLPIRFYDKHTHGELMSRFTNDTDTMREMISNALPQIFSSCITIVGMVTAMIIYSPLLTLIVFAVLFGMIVFVGKIGKISGKFFGKMQNTLGSVNGYIEELIEGQKVVKVFCHEDKVKEEFSEINNELCKNATTANTCANILMPIMGNLGYILYVLVAIVGSVLTINQGMAISISIGTLISFLQFTRNISQPITQTSQQFNSILLALTGAERIFKIMDEPVEEDNGYVTLVNATVDENGNAVESKERTGYWMWKHPHKADNTITYKAVEGDVQFDNVVFAYEENKTVLQGISLYAKPGQKVAFVGSTGAGKTTITNLINRFYDVPDGKIRYDGININKIRKSDLRRSLGMVLQETNLFTGTVMENIRYGKLDATDEECISASKLANADSFITRLPDGYQTVLTGNGANLSQGQRQLLSIARAAVADPPVLILDEATSSIDTRTEKIIEHGMDKLMEGRTVFVIAHRLSTVQNADAIMVLEDGKIIERGSHAELLKLKGKYFELYNGLELA
ncbi:ABC transporter ATP-binding protein [bacterium]|nr:ABC transporter ATP-binding protein [bacterium]